MEATKAVLAKLGKKLESLEKDSEEFHGEGFICEATMYDLDMDHAWVELVTTNQQGAKYTEDITIVLKTMEDL